MIKFFVSEARLPGCLVVSVQAMKSTVLVIPDVEEMAFATIFRLLLSCSYLCILLSCKASAQRSTFVPADVLLINCGSSGRTPDNEKRQWRGDVDPKFVVISSDAASTVATASSQPPSVPSVPFMTARIFTAPATYSIPVAPRRKFLRLYFYPSAYGGLRASAAAFDVEAGDYNTALEHKLLLRNFTPAWDVEALKLEYIIREYSLNVSKSGFLNLTFTPSSGSSYAFINGIEVVSMPNIFTASQEVPFVGHGMPFDIYPSIALETIHRLNVGGSTVTRNADSGLFREWKDDSMYIFGSAFGLTRTIDSNITLRYPPATPTYIAPDAVYATQRYAQRYTPWDNLTWMFTVDPGFYHLIRLHFCDIHRIYNKPNERVFSIFINNMTAQENSKERNMTVQSSGLGVPFYKDYVAYADAEQADFRLDLHPTEVDATLNGLEVFKLENNNNLAGSPPKALHSVTVDPAKVSGHTRMIVGSGGRAPIIGGVVGGFIVIFGIALVLYGKNRQRRTAKSGFQSRSDRPQTILPSKYCSSTQMGSIQTSNVCRRFTFAEIQDATQGFADNLVIGEGGFGKVYKGVIHHDKSTASASGIKVAVKRAHPTSDQGIREFLNEVEMLSKLRHRHLVSLFGFCDEQGEMILVYEFMANGTLREHLYSDSGLPTLRWRQRLDICIDAARGLHYLHTGAKQIIIHRDVKTTNILLDEAWVAKVADFGLCKVGSEMERRNVVVSTAVKGSFGYLDPEYYRRQKLTDKSDVYSFGVVLFEVLCSRPAVNVDLPHEQVSLAEWARYCYENGVMDAIVDQNLKKEIAPDCFVKFCEIAHKCISDNGLDRPSMGDVLWSLESALQLQENSKMEPDSSTTNASSSHRIDWPITDYAAFTSNVAIFSEIADPRGR